MLFLYMKCQPKKNLTDCHRVLVGLADKVADFGDVRDLSSAPGLNGSIGSICFAVLPIFATSGGKKTWKTYGKIWKKHGKIWKTSGKIW